MPSFPKPDKSEPPEVPVPAPSAVYTYRLERYMELGFTEVDSHALAVALEAERDSRGRTWTRPLNWRRVEKALRSGCSLEQAVAIFS